MTWVLPVVVLLSALAALAWWVSRWEQATVLGHLNAIAPDGDVERYTAAFHARIQGNFRFMAGAFIVMAVLLAAMRKRIGEAMTPAASGAWGRFRADLREVRERYAKRTSFAHKRSVLLLILAGAALRAWLMPAAITYDEAFTWTYYASRPLHVILSDLSYPNNHILHTLLVKLFTTVLGVGTISLRLPAFLAGVAVMPLFYLFVRATFNRYIALMALAMVAASGPLIEYGALARGYTLTWLALMAALLLGRHFVKENNPASALLLALVLALGLWTTPVMVYQAAFVYVWIGLQLAMRYRTTLDGRLRALVLSMLLCAGLTVLAYLPGLLTYGAGHVLRPGVTPEDTREAFRQMPAEHAYALYAYIMETSWKWLAIAGSVAILAAGYFSARYRMLLAALALGAIPLVLAQGVVAPPRAWLYILFFLHLGVAIGLFYLLKWTQEKLLTSMGKRVRAAGASVVLLVLGAWPALGVLPDRIERYPEARLAAAYLREALEPGDRVYTMFPWEAPIEFHAKAMGIPRSVFHQPPEAAGIRFVAASPADRQHWKRVLAHHKVDTLVWSQAEMVKDWPRLEIFAARQAENPVPGAPETGAE
ncbi:MAG: glycosyltransferase family 39 protein [Flavobacteriales bacterium]|nr:glycosyltransferase family 39 protein [Flavobacteriales bacterium]